MLFSNWLSLLPRRVRRGSSTGTRMRKARGRQRGGVLSGQFETATSGYTTLGATELLEERTLLSSVTFDWEMVPRTVADENGRIAIPNTRAYAQPEFYEIVLSVVDTTDEAIDNPAAYQWLIDGMNPPPQVANEIPLGTPVPLTDDLRARLPDFLERGDVPQFLVRLAPDEQGPGDTYVAEGTYELTVVGPSAQSSEEITFRDFLIVSLGDSYSSGEGAPEVTTPDIVANQFNSLDPALLDRDPALSPSDGNQDVWARTSNAFSLDEWLVRTVVDDPATMPDPMTGLSFNEADIELQASSNPFHFAAHRTSFAHPAQAALALEQSDPHSTVTFVFLSQSGATIANGGIGPYEGIAPVLVGAGDAAVPVKLHSQVDQAAVVVGNRQIDAVNLSFGGNDMGFKLVIIALAFGDLTDASPDDGEFSPSQQRILDAFQEGTRNDANEWQTALLTAVFGPSFADDGRTFSDLLNLIPNFDLFSEFTGNVAGVANLQADYALLNNEIMAKLNVAAPDDIYITEYPNFTRLGEDGGPESYDFIRDFPAQNLGLPFVHPVTAEELDFLTAEIYPTFTASVQQGAAAHGWTFVDGVNNAYVGHGYQGLDGDPRGVDDYVGRNVDLAADDVSWIRGFQQSERLQGDMNGVVHPNRLGNQATGQLVSQRVGLSLADDGFVNTIVAGAGDAVTVDLRERYVVDATNFSFSTLSLPDINETATIEPTDLRPLIPDADPLLSEHLVRVDGEIIGRLFLSDRIDDEPFSTTGRFYFLPSLESDLASDADPDQLGFQGRLEFAINATRGVIPELGGIPRPLNFTATVDVREGYSTAPHGMFPVTLSGSGENQLRLEQRLAFLAFRDAEGGMLDPDENPDADTTAALRLFQAATDFTGNAVPFDPFRLVARPEFQTSGALDIATINWLNHVAAPRWQALIDPDVPIEFSADLDDVLGNFDVLPLPDPGTEVRSGATPAVEVFATSWLVDVLRETARELRVQYPTRGLIINGLSTAGAIESANDRSASSPGRLHSAGMEVDLTIPAGANNASPGPGLNADEQYVFDLVMQLAEQGNSLPQPIRFDENGDGIVLSNQKLIDAINAVFNPENELGKDVASNNAGNAPDNVLHVAFTANLLTPGIASKIREIIADVADGVVDLFNTIISTGPLGFEVPLLSDPDNAGNPDANDTVTIGELLGIRDLFQENLIGPLLDFFSENANPTPEELADALNFEGSPFEVVVAPLTDAMGDPISESLAIEFRIDESTELFFALSDLIELATLNFIEFENGDLPIIANLLVEGRIGVDLNRGCTAAEAGFIELDTFALTLNADTDAGTDLTLGFGTLEAVVNNVMFNLEAALDVTVTDGNPADGDGNRVFFGEDPEVLVVVRENVLQTHHVVSEFPLSVNIGGFSSDSLAAGDRPKLMIRDVSLFDDQAPETEFDLGALDVFERLSKSSLVSLFDQFGAFLGDLTGSPALSRGLPLTNGATLGDFIRVADTFRTSVLDPLTSGDGPGDFGFRSIQELASQLGTIGGLDFDEATNELSFEIRFGEDFADELVDLDLPLRGSDTPLASIETFGGLNAEAGLEGGFRLVIDLSEPGLDAMGNRIVSSGSTIASLTDVFGSAADGDGLADGYRFDNAVDPSVRGNGAVPDLTITLRDGRSFTADFSGLSSASTLQDVATVIAASAPVGAFVARVDDEEQGFVFEDSTQPSGPESRFRIQTSNGSMVGLLLGIIGRDEDDDGVINGAALHGDSLSRHARLEELPEFDTGAGFQFVAGQVALTAENVGAKAQFGGLVCLEIGFHDPDGNGPLPSVPNGSGQIAIDAGVTLNDPTPTDGLTLDDLLTLSMHFDDVTPIGATRAVEFDLVSSANFDFDSILIGDCAGSLPNLGDLLGDDPGITIDWPDLFIPSLRDHDGNPDTPGDRETGFFDFNLEDLNVEFTGFGGLDGFGDFDTGDVLDMLRRLADFVGSLSGYDFLNFELPGIGRSLGDLFDLADRFRLAIGEFEENPDLVLDDLALELGRLLGPDFGEIGLSLDSTGAFPVLRFDLPYQLVLSESGVTPTINDSEVGMPNSAGFAVGDTQLTLDSVAGLPRPTMVNGELQDDFFIQIGAEVLHVTEVNVAARTLTVERGQSGTMATAHSASERVHLLYSLPLDLDLRDFGIDLGSLIDFRTGGQLLVTGGLTLNLAVGLEIRDGAPVPFLFDDGTNAAATFAIEGTGLRFDTTVGPFGISVGLDEDNPDTIGIDESAGGTLFLNQTGVADAAPAGFLFELADADGDNRHVLPSPLEPDAAADAFNALVADFGLNEQPVGALQIALPLFCSDGTPMLLNANAPVGQQHILTVSVTDLLQPIETFDISPDDFSFDTIADCFGVDFSLDGNLDSLIAGLDGLLGLLQDALAGRVFGVPLPLIGNRLRAASDFIGDLRSEIVGQLESAGDKTIGFVQQKIFDAFGSDGLGWLLDSPNGDLAHRGGISRDDVRVLINGVRVADLSPQNIPIDIDTVQFDVSLGATLLDFETSLDGDLGIPALGFQIDGMLHVTADFVFDLGFGVSLTDGVFFSAGDASDLQLNFDAEIMELDAQANLGPLQVDVRQLRRDELTPAERADRTVTVGGEPIEAINAFRGAFIIDLAPGDADGRLTLDEFGSTSLFSTEIGAAGSIDLDLMASLGGDARFPSIGAELHAVWNPGDGSPLDLSAFSIALPDVSFDGVRLNLGEFFSDFFAPMLQTIQQIVAPLQPIIDVLTAPLPVISDLMDDDVSLLDLAILYGPPQLAGAGRFIESLDTITDLLNLPEFGDAGAFLPLGGFNVAFSPNGGAVSVGAETPEPDPFSRVSPVLNRYLSSIPQTESRSNAPDATDGMFSFPIIDDPSEVFGLLLGQQDATLVTYDIPDLDFEFMYRQFFPIIGPLGVSIGGALGAHVDFKVGFDTKGLFAFKESGNVLDIFDGLFFSDTDSPNPMPGQADVPELQLTGSLTATAELNLGIARGGVEGGIFANIDFNLHDENNDGKVRLGEILDSIALGDLGIHIFDVSGRVRTGLEAFVEIDYLVDTWRRSVRIAPDVTLLDFEIDRPSPPPAPPNPVLASIQNDGTLLIHVGENVSRLSGDPGVVDNGEMDSDDVVMISGGTSPGQVVVSAFGLRQTFDAGDSANGMTAITRVLVESGSGADMISASSTLRLPLIVDAGSGNDRVTAGGSATTVIGGLGADTITGSIFDDSLDGGDGNDVILAGLGNDLVIGGGGDDQLDAGPNDDTVRGDDGNDTIMAGRGDDCVTGGAGDDQITGDTGRDEIDGQDGDDLIDGGDGEDVLRGGAGEDTIEGGAGNDELDGGDDDDVLDGGLSNDVVRGGAGDDELFGGQGADTMDGGAGDDLLVAGRTTRPYSQAEVAAINALVDPAEQARRRADLMLRGAGERLSQHDLTGGDGDDTIHGDLGDDVIRAGAGANVVFAYAGNDVITSGSGDDVIDSGDGNDDINVGDGQNTVRGGAGSETVTSGSGNDDIDLRRSSSYSDDMSDQNVTTHVVMAGAGDNRVFTDSGSDVITTLDGDDTISAGDGNNSIDAGGGDNSVMSGSGLDTIRTGDGADTVRSGAGADDINTGGGNDSVDAGSGNDTIFTESGDDTVIAGAGHDRVFLSAGDDVAMGGDGNDLIVGDIGNDFLDGGAGIDVLWGGAQIFDQSRFDPNVPANFVLPPEFAANEAVTPTGYSPPLITPSVVGGRSLPGTIDDGADTIEGGAGGDFLFGGGLSDSLSGGDGDDFIDGGSGPETIHGGGGDDVIFGGGNDDRIFGDAGIDQLYGNEGDDLLVGGAGVRADGSDATPGDIGTAHFLAGQRLYGNDGADTLFAFAPSLGAVEYVLRGDELYGGSGNDLILGNIRSEILSGGAGNEAIRGDGLIGPTFADNPFADVVGGNDTIYGDGGEDELLGGGGDDVIFGGANSDYLEGQDGNDALFGGSGIDFLKFDTSTEYSQFGDNIDGHFGNRAQGDTPDDNATDILLIEGTQLDDTILLSERQTGITSTRDVAAGLQVNGRLTDTAEFSLRLGFGSPVNISVPMSANTTFDQFVGQLNAALQVAFGNNAVRAVRVGPRIRIETNIENPGFLQTLTVTAANSVAVHELGLLVDQTSVPLLNVNLNGQQLTAGWRDANGNPLVEQFQISGLGGDDELGFEAGTFAVDFGDLAVRSRDWIAVLNGGSGDDILSGANGRDRLDGGRGSDLLFGNGGDDRLFGDTSNGASTDIDALFAGAGNDDLIGGLGQNRLFAWSFDPSGPLHFEDGATANKSVVGPDGLPGTMDDNTAMLTAFARQFRDGQLPHPAFQFTPFTFSLSLDGGDFVDVRLEPFRVDDNTSIDDLVNDLNFALQDASLAADVTAGHNGNGRLTFSTTRDSIAFRGDQFGVFVETSGELYDTEGDEFGTMATMTGGGGFDEVRPLEDTGLNRMLGQSRSDVLYGGTGLDFLYGNGGDDLLVTRDGELFENGFDVPAGDEWKAYARSTDRVWYYGGTDAADVISVDYVTEPGLLADHHLITRLTENNGNFTFDASVRLDFNATDENGALVWDASDLVASVSSIIDRDPEDRQMAFNELVLNGNLLPSEGDFLAIIIDALDGNDVINVGPTVQKTVWVDAGAGDDTVTFQTGNAILVDRTEEQNRNEVAGQPGDTSRAFDLFGPTRLIAVAPGPVEGRLSGRARFDLSLNGGDPVRLVLPEATTAGNATLDDLVGQLNGVLDASSLAGRVRAVNASGRVAFEPTSVSPSGSLEVTAVNAIAAGELFLTPGLRTTSNLLSDSVSFTNLTIDNPSDVDWYAFQLAEIPDSFRIDVSSLSENDDLDVQIVRLDEFGQTFIQTDEPLEFLPNTTIKPDRLGSLLIAQFPPVESGVLPADASFVLRLLDGNGLSHNLDITVTAAATAGNLDADALAIDLQVAINTALAEAGLLDSGANDANDANGQNGQNDAVDLGDSDPGSLPSPLSVSLINGRLAIAPSSSGGLSVVSVQRQNGDAFRESFGFVADQAVGEATNAFPIGDIAGVQQISGGSIFGAGDTDFFRFSIDDATAELNSGVMTLNVSNFGTHVRASLFSLTQSGTENGRPDDPDFLLFSREVGATMSGNSGSVGLPLTGLAAGEYLLKIQHDDPLMNSQNTRYSLNVFGLEGNSSIINVAGKDAAGGAVQTPTDLVPGRTFYIRVQSDSRIPTVYDLTLEFNGGADNGHAAPVEINLGRQSDAVRRDVILGGPGNDRLQGGPSEDWIFGGDGNDVLTGGTDQQASDLIFGGPGDDLFQIVPDRLPTNEAGQTILTTQSDRFDGGEGFDQVLFLGGDYDRLSRPVPDHVAISFNRFLQRYEFTSLQWDIANQEFVTASTGDSPVTIESTEIPALNGRLSGAATFDLSVNGNVAVSVTIPSDATNGSVSDLVQDINIALMEAGFERDVFAITTRQGIQLSTTATGFGVSLQLSNANAVTTNELFLGNTTVFGGQRTEFLQLYAYYQTLNIEGTLIDTRAGDDEVHADPEYRFPLADGTGFTETEYGIKLGNFQEGATIGSLRIEGGDGNDRLFGGVLNDTINGGDGSDYISGGEGDDSLIGGPGFDLIVGASGLEPDRFEAVTRDGESGFNDLVAFAAPLDLPAGSFSDVSFNGLSFNLGDSGDWYVLDPQAASSFAGSSAARLQRSDISVEFDSPTDMTVFEDARFTSNSTGRTISGGPGLYFLFAASRNDALSELSLVPVETFVGVPDFYLLHVVNPHSLQIGTAGVPVISGAGLDVEFTLTINGTTSAPIAFNVPSASTPGAIVDLIDARLNAVNANIGGSKLAEYVFADFDVVRQRIFISLRQPGELKLNSADGSASALLFLDGQNNLGPADEFGRYTLNFAAQYDDVIDIDPTFAPLQTQSASPSDVPAFIPLGDLDNDQIPDFIAAIQDSRATRSDLNNAPGNLHPHELAGPSFARVHFGVATDGPDSSRTQVYDGTTLTLQLPAPVLQASYGVQSHIAAGDFDGDGINDIAILVGTVETPQTAGRDTFSGSGLYILRGKNMRAEWFADGAVVDIVTAADVVFTGYDQAVSLTSPGNIIGASNFDDLVVAQSGGDTLVYAGVTGVTRNRNAVTSAADKLSGSASIVSPLGNVVDSTRPDWAAIVRAPNGDTTLHIVAGITSTHPDGPLANVDFATVNLGNILPGARVLPAGDLDLDGFDDFIVHVQPDINTTNSIIVYGGAMLDVRSVPGRIVIPVGQFDGGAADVLIATSEVSESADEDGTELFHTVFEYFSDHGTARGNWAQIETFVPTLVFEQSFDLPSETNRASFIGRQITSFGDLNNDSFDDFALSDRFGAFGHVFFGGFTDFEFVNFPVDDSIEAFEFELATPRLTPVISRSGIDLNEPAEASILAAFRVEGLEDRERLGNSQSIGDYNGDGLDDLLMWGSERAYVQLGPVKFDGVDRADERAEIIIDLTGGWTPAFGEGDINGDGRSDIVFTRNSVSSTDAVVLTGVADPERFYAAENLVRITTLVLPGNFRSNINPENAAHLLDFNGDGQTDLLIAAEQPLFDVNSPYNRAIGYVFGAAELTAAVNGAGAADTNDPTVVITYETPNASLFKDDLFGVAAGDYSSSSQFIELQFDIADLNGDGRDEVLVLVRDEYQFNSPRRRCCCRIAVCRCWRQHRPV
jgi:Ca2+-binding RTX toxin-like protein